MNNIEELERRYQVLASDFQTGRIDEATFTSTVDQLQFQDEWGRYWMIGAQSGAWHYYDGQSWHQADPREADKLPFMDDQGRYWQRGTKSGDWYYYQPETGEWVKPSPGEGPPSPTGQGTDRGASPSYYQSYLQQQSVDTGPGLPSQQFDGELYQDDEGRYWAVGSKTGQWYFFDSDGWHPAHEFQPTVGPQPPHSQPYQSYGYQPSYSSQAYYQAPPPAYPPVQDSQAYYHQPAQPYIQPYPPVYSQPASPAPQQPQPHTGEPVGRDQHPLETQGESVAPGPGTKDMPQPPTGDPQSGSWFYFDGKQWLKYASEKPEEAPPPAPETKEEARETEPPKTEESETKSEPVVAEFIEEEEASPEVVDVEVITVVEAEPDEPKPKPQEESAPPPRPMSDGEVRPRRSRRASDAMPSRSAPAEPEQPARERAASDPGRSVMPRKKGADEPSIIIPTGAAASTISSASSPRVSSKPVGAAGQSAAQRRPRENTLPMDTPTARSSAASPGPRVRHGEVTQAMPTVNRASARSDTAPIKSAQTPRQVTQQMPAPAAAKPAGQPAEARPQKKGYTFGDVLRSLPSTIWTLAGGIIVLLMFAFIIVAAWSWMNRNDFSVGGLAVAPSATPTLANAAPDATPTPAPTPVSSPDASEAAEAAEVIPFSSSELGITLEYPETWYREEDDNFVIFSPVEEGLDPEEFNAISLWIRTEDIASISDLLAEELAKFPSDVDNLNEGTISIASQVWTSVQIRFDNENLGGQGIATLAVTGKDGRGYTLVAIAPADEWNSVQPTFQEMINSFRFGTREIAQQPESELTPQATGQAAAAAESPEEDEGSQGPAPTPTAPAPTATPTIEATATPLIYVVESGDTLLAIANLFGVSVDLLADKNGITDPGALSIGQELVIPFTAEELAAYNASGGAVQPSSSSGGSSGGSDATTESEAADPSEAAAGGAPETAAESEAPEPASAAAEAPAPSGEPAAISGKIIYPAYNPGTNTYDLWLADVTTGEQTGLVSEASQPAFNRDGSLLAYRSWALGTRGIFFRDFVGGRGGQVTRFVEDGLPVWAPDAFSFVFASRREGDRVPRLYIGDQQGENDYSIGFQGEYPSVFPDGRIVSRGCLPTGDCGVFVVGPRGGGEVKISGDRSDTAHAVSPDGSKIAFMSSNRSGGNWEIWVMNADGSDPQRLTNNGNNDGLPTWSPDGQSVAYVSDQGGVWGIWVMNADGSNQRSLFNMKGSIDGVVLRDEANSKGWLEERISWAP